VNLEGSAPLKRTYTAEEDKKQCANPSGTRHSCSNEKCDSKWRFDFTSVIRTCIHRLHTARLELSDDTLQFRFAVFGVKGADAN
jgi:hypothetical protein